MRISKKNIRTFNVRFYREMVELFKNQFIFGTHFQEEICETHWNQYITSKDHPESAINCVMSEVMKREHIRAYVSDLHDSYFYVIKRDYLPFKIPHRIYGNCDNCRNIIKRNELQKLLHKYNKEVGGYS